MIFAMDHKEQTTELTYRRFVTGVLIGSVAIVIIQGLAFATRVEIDILEVALVGDPPYAMRLTFAAWVITMGLATAGLVWSPVASLLSYFGVRSIPTVDGLPVWRKAAMSSCAALLPWLMLQTYLSGRRVPQWVSGTTYVFVLAMWLLGPLGQCFCAILWTCFSRWCFRWIHDCNNSDGRIFRFRSRIVKP